MVDFEELRRNSRITLDREGRFYHEGEVLENERIQALFRRGILVREDGAVTLHVGKQWCYVECEGMALFVRGIFAAKGGDGEGPSEIQLHLSDGTEETLDPKTLVMVGQHDLYCLVKEGRVSARFLRGAYHQIAEHFQNPSDESMSFALNMADRNVEICASTVPPPLSIVLGELEADPS